MLPGVHPGQAVGPAGALDEIRRLAGGGNLAEAIERYRQAYGVDEQEAGNVIEALQTGRLATAAAPGMRAPEELTKALEDVQRRLKAGDKIGAIKVYREHYDVSLERAKYAVEQIEAGQTLQPETGFQALNRPMQVSQPSRSGGRAGGIILVLVLLFVAGLIGFIVFASGGGLGRHSHPVRMKHRRLPGCFLMPTRIRVPSDWSIPQPASCSGRLLSCQGTGMPMV
jgi:ribosomal protein L7/L12